MYPGMLLKERRRQYSWTLAALPPRPRDERTSGSPALRSLHSRRFVSPQEPARERASGLDSPPRHS
eukprot:15437492-Alexandrium_andersonii.AAC.1